MSSSISSGMEEEEDEDSESFYDAPDDIIDIHGCSFDRNSSRLLLRSSDTLTNNEQFSTCKGDTLKTIADENFARNSQRLEYEDDGRSSHHNFDDSVSSGNRAENEDEDDVIGGQHSDWTNEEESPLGDVMGSWQKKHCSDKTLTSADRGSRDVTEIEMTSQKADWGNLETSGTQRKARRGDHLSLDNLSAAFVPALTSDSGTSFTPSSDQHDLLELPLPPYPHSHSQSKSSSLPSSDRDDSSDRAHRSHRSATTGGTQGTYNNTSTTTTVAASPCDFFKTLDRYYAPTGTEDSGSDHSGSTNTTQETKHAGKKLGIKATPRKILTKLKRRGTTNSSSKGGGGGGGTSSRDSAFIEQGGSSVGGSSYTSGGLDVESRTTVSDCRERDPHHHPLMTTHIPAYHSDNYPEQRDKTFSKSSTIVQVMQSHQHNLAIWCLKFSSCGKYLAAAGQDKIIRVWVLRTEFDSLNVLNKTPTTASSSASVTAGGGGGGSHSPHSLAYASQRSLEGSLKANSLKSDDSANEAAAAATPNNLNTSPFLPDPYRTFAKHSSDVMDISWSPSNSSYLLSASMDKSVRLWHIHMNKCLGAFDHQNIVTCVSFPPAPALTPHPSLSLLPPPRGVGLGGTEHLKNNNNVFLSGAMDGKVRIWSITEKKVLNFYEASGGKKQPITCLCFHAGGEYILVGTLSGQVLKLDALQLRLMSQTRLLTSKSGKLRRGSVKIVSIQESPRFPETFLVSSSDCRIRLYEAAQSSSSSSTSSSATTGATGSERTNSSQSSSSNSSGTGFWRLKAKYKGHSNKNSPIRTGFSRLGNFVMSGSECKGVFIWNTEPLDAKAKNTIFECLQAHEVSVTAATFSPTVEAIECLDSCQRRLLQHQLQQQQQQQSHKQKSASSSSVNFSCSNPQVSNTNNMAPSSNTPQKCLNPIGLDSAGAPAVVNNNNIPGDTQESAASPSSWCGASGTAGVGCARATGAPALVLNDAASVDVGVGVDGEESSQGGSCGGASVERRPQQQQQQHQNNCSPPAFTVKSLVVGEVFASADYTGKINVYFA